MTDGVVDDGNFLAGYFFGNFRDKTSNIMWRYATLYQSCKMNDLE